MPSADDFQIIDDTDDDHVAEFDEATQAELADRLDRNRIQQLSKLRRATYRSRSYAMIAALACGIGAIQAGVVAVDRYRVGGLSIWAISAIGFLLILAVALAIAVQRIVLLNRELRLSVHREAIDVDRDQQIRNLQ